MIRRLVLGGLLAFVGCSHPTGPSVATAVAPTTSSVAAPVSSAAPPISPVSSNSTPSTASAQLQAAVLQRAEAYEEACATDDAFPSTFRTTADALAWMSLGSRPTASAPWGPPPLDRLRAAVAVSCSAVIARDDAHPPDFDASTLLRLVYRHGSALPPDVTQSIHDALIGFKYWIDEGGTDNMVFWSENHQILLATAETLAGQLYPAETFTNSGLTGLQHVQKARPRVMRWLDERLRFGFSEWNSPGYYEEDFSALFNLADFAQDPAVQERACMVMDLMLFDLARLNLGGSFAPSSGRCYGEWKTNAHFQSVGNLMQILFGTRGQFDGPNSPAAHWLATSTRYKAPSVLLAIGQDTSGWVDRSRVSISFDEAPSVGIGFTSLDDGMFWWGHGAYVAKQTIATTRSMVLAWNDANMKAELQSDLGPIAPVFYLLPDADLAAAADAASPLTEGMCLTRANLYTYRRPDVMLSSAQDYRRGQVGPQQQIWQATLGTSAVVFTTAPGQQNHDGPNYWTGNATMPEVVQSEDALIAAYDPSLIAVAQMGLPETHAWFDATQFDESETRGSWTFGRKGTGYVGLYSDQPIAANGSDLVASGWQNIFICQVGDEARWTTFAAFKDACAQAPISVHYPNALDTSPIRVDYGVPGRSTLELDYGGQATLGGQPLATDEFPRFENPYSQTAWGSPTTDITFGGFTLHLYHDASSDVRQGDGL
ncbi:MAG TPA: hypothetical protein VFF73_02745 [Planctomycetota bacterium]|nr:hypothetical protein [Planctomycetota bacterium]